MALSVKSKLLEIGVRKPKEITIYCLSMADEVKFTSVIAAAYYRFQELSKKEPFKPLPEADPSEEDIVGYMESLEADSGISPEAVSFLIEAIRDNLTDILKMICEEEVTLADLTNEQFADICEVIYDMNFTGAVGKFQSLWSKIKNIYPQTKQSPK